MTTATPGSTHVVSPGVPSAAVLAAGVGVLAVATALFAGLADGGDTSARTLGVAIGTAIVLLFFGTGALVVDIVAGAMPAASLLVALLTYLLQVVLLGIAFLAIDRSGLTASTLDARWLGCTVIVATLAWTAGQIMGEVRSRQPIFGSTS